MIKVLIVDDSALVRQSFKAILESDPQIEVVATASDPYIAVQKIQKNTPDVITLDLVMPKMDGLTFLRKLMKQAPMPVVVISNQTNKGAEIALKALEYGATTIMAKPKISTADQLIEAKVELVDRVKAAYFAGKKGRFATGLKNYIPDTSQRVLNKEYSNQTVIAIGASTGGTEAIKQVLLKMPVNCPPILIVQHMPEKFTASFASRLDQSCSIVVKEAKHNEQVKSGVAYIAKGGHHMSLVKSSNKLLINISTGELVNRHRPSVNVLFDSVANVIGKHAVGVILTGMGDDGATGLLNMKQKGAYTIAQDEKTSVVFGMPLRAIENDAVEKILPLEEISDGIYNYLSK
ncbi:protein-glutamate methylesterase/protein-glutamine glutaminase [Marinigracilibium pacificum]|nr:chemotaxis response regulator protein-glutamate methylesterase [Marinigracilibium pacificum]